MMSDARSTSSSGPTCASSSQSTAGSSTTNAATAAAAAAGGGSSNGGGGRTPAAMLCTFHLHNKCLMGRHCSFSHDLKRGKLCTFHMEGTCRFKERCAYIHGDECPKCKRPCLHPFNKKLSQSTVDYWMVVGRAIFFVHCLQCCCCPRPSG